MTTSTSPSVLPLTTSFNPPESCLNTTPAVLVTLASNTGLRYHQGPTDPAGCFPDGWSPVSYFSPGLCPSSYTIADQTEISIGTATETRAICCAGGLSIDPPKATLPWGEREPCIAYLPQTATQTDGHVINKAYYNGYGVSIRWQATDFTTPTATTTPKTTSTSSPSPLAAALETHTGLSTGAKAGIGVGAGVGGLLLIMAVLGLFWLRRKRQDPPADDNQPTYNGLAVRDLSANHRVTELPSQPYHMDEPHEPSYYRSPTPDQGHGRFGHSESLRSTVPSRVQSPYYASSSNYANSHTRSVTPAELDIHYGRPF